VGVFQNSNEQDLYWVESPDSMSRQFYMDEELFKSLFVDYENPQQKWNSVWYVLYDYSNIKSDQVDHILTTLEDLSETIKKIDVYHYVEHFGQTLKDFQVKQHKLENILFLLEVPILILLLIFIYMVNNQMMLLERGDIAVLKSRGASNGHIILIYLIQGLIMASIGLLLGIPLGLLICYALGNANAFLEFVSRSSLEIELTKGALYSALLCGLSSIIICLGLAFIHTRETIVSHKRKLNRSSRGSIIRSFVMGFVFLGIGIYGLYSFRIQANALMQVADLDTSLDPLLFLSSIFFIIGAAFIVQGIFPILLRLIYQLGIKLWGPSSYASFQQVIKGSANQGFIILFLILTVSLGIYSASIARTINENEENRLVYSTSSDLVLKEKWESNEDSIEIYITTMRELGQNVNESSLDVYYVEPDFNRYLQLEGVDKATKVFVNNNVQVSVDKGRVNTKLMGIDTKDFGETAYFKTNLLDKHWYHYLNDLAKDENGVIVSSNFKEKYGYKLGDIISYQDHNGSGRSTITGFVDYWPSYQPIIKEQDGDGVVKEIDQFLIVANLSKLQASWGIMPYEVWIKAKDSTGFIYDFARDNNIEYQVFEDLSSKIINKNNDPFFQGTNGVLTLGFIVILLVCAVGFLIFWILSILSRSLQIGVFRAMGMSKLEVFRMLIQEQLFLSVIPILIGLIIGNIVSKLYVPLIQIAYTTSEQIIPLEVINLQEDRIRILMIVGVMIVLCMLLIGKLISNLKITHALKLGED
jgi:putative ABC transport system permease protein